MFRSRVLHPLVPALLCLLMTGAGCAIQGDAEQVLPDGSVYEGELLQGRLHGEGRLESPRGTVYEGEFRRGLMHGEGRITFPDGRVFTGRFEEGEPAGVMEYRDEDGYQYRGEVLDWQFHGEGELIDPEGNKYKGYFYQGQPEGEGRYEGADGERYEGNFEQGQYQGMGRHERPDGGVYEGMFEAGRYHGQGTLKRSDPEPWEEEELTGAWEHGEYVEGRDERRRKAMEHNEWLLYHQPRLLEEALAQLKTPDGDDPNLYLLAVAGDGREEVFRREAEFVRTQFEELFGIAGRSVLLVNSRTSTTQYPMATRESIKRALKGIAERMDPEEDILFVYLTSHGSRNHELFLTRDGLILPDLAATELAEMLDDLPIRWKAVTVSACFSGGFIEPLASDDTLVMTAARPDRSSFGCYDQAPLTWFGRALLKDALPDAESFPDALERAAELVKEREDEREIEHHSEPQLHAPEPIRRQLEKWWRAHRR